MGALAGRISAASATDWLMGLLPVDPPGEKYQTPTAPPITTIRITTNTATKRLPNPRRVRLPALLGACTTLGLSFGAPAGAEMDALVILGGKGNVCTESACPFPLAGLDVAG